jgi:hypothetical protein
MTIKYFIFQSYHNLFMTILLVYFFSSSSQYKFYLQIAFILNFCPCFIAID